MSRSKKSAKNFAYALVGQSVGLIISFISRIVFIKILGSEYLGLNGLFSNILTVLSLAELGIGEAITFSLYKPLAEDNKLNCAMLMQFYKKTYIIIGLIILIVGVSITPLLPFLIKDMPNIEHINIIYILFVINTSVSYFFSYKRNLIIADQNRYIATFYRYLFYFILNMVQIIFLLINHNYFLFLILQIIFTIIENLCISIKADKMYPYLKSKNKMKLDNKSKMEIVKNTKAMIMHRIGSVVVNSTDNLLLSAFVGLSVVGIYSNYYLIINALNLVFGQLFNSLTASVGNLIASESRDKQYDVFQKINFLNFWIYSFSSICLLCLFNDFIEIWVGKEYVFSYNIVIIIIINFYVNGMRKTILMFKDAAGLFYQDRWKSVIEATINLVVSILLAMNYGAIGIFIGTLISSITTCLWVEPFVLYKYCFGKNIKNYFKEYAKRLMITLCLSFTMYIMCSLIHFNIYISLILKLLLCVLIVNSVYWVLYHNSSEYKYVKSKIFDKILKKGYHAK